MSGHWLGEEEKVAKGEKLLKILVVDTAYWGILEATGLERRFSNASLRDSQVAEYLETSSSSGPGLARSLRLAGHDVKLHLANSPGFAAVVSSRINPCSEYVENFFWRNWQIISRIPLFGDFLFSQSRMFKEIISVAKGSPFDMVYVLNPNLTTPRLSKILSSPMTSLVGQIASPLPPKKFFRSYKLMVSAHPGQVAYFRRIGLQAISVPLAIDKNLVPAVFKPHSQRGIEICFVGSFSRHHRSGTQTIQKLCREFPQIRIYSLTSRSRLRRLGLLGNFAGAAWGSDMMKIYSNSKIVINRHGKVANGFAVNFRMFEATASGAMLITEAAPNLGSLFAVGTEVEQYESLKALKNKLKLALENPSQTEEIGLAGFRAVSKRHTSEVRYAELAKILETVRPPLPK